jgi:sialate O-acetylesterase
MHASTQPETLRVNSGGEAIAFSNVLVGDVWLCSGQSNMGFKLANCTTGKSDAANASDTLLRVNAYRGAWEPCVGEVASETSGVAYYFGRKLRETSPDVPVGLIVRALSGTPIESWIPTNAMANIPFAMEMMKRYQAESDEGKRWIAYAESAAERKKARRQGEQKAAGKRLQFDGDDNTKVLAEIYYEGNPGRLWRERIRPLAGYTIAGVIWYQGERNSKAGEATATTYRDLLVALITSWRAAWEQGDFRFLAVQLPPFAKGDPHWKIVQTCQAEAVNRVANAACIDLNDLPDDGLHPPNKRPVG